MGLRDLGLISVLGSVLLAYAQAPVPGVDFTPQPRLDIPSTLPEGWEHGAFMEIFVRAYQDSDGDGVGDLKGLISRLDYLKELGVSGLWLMPITPSADHDHGYATTDYRGVEPDYGTLADLDEMLKQAHARGMGVVMDYVVNHSSYQHPLFTQSLQGDANPYRDWYVWSQEAPQGWEIWGKNPWYWAQDKPWLFTGEWKDLPHPPAGAHQYFFGTFGPHMPDFNLRNPKVFAWHEDNLRFWLNRGLDGFRLDAIPHLIENDAVRWNDQPESRALAKRLQDLIKSYPQRYVVCEATIEPHAYGDPAVCGGAFAFGYTQHFVQAAKGNAASVQELARFYRKASPTMATFVSNHDLFAGRRLWDQVQGNIAQYKLAAAGYLLQPGTPFIYYGEEVGQAGNADLPGDRPNRAPMSWSATAAARGFSSGAPFRALAPNLATHNAAQELDDSSSILAFYRALLKLRNRLPSIARGSFEHSFAQDLVLGFERRWGAEHSLVLLNYGTASVSVALDELPASARLQPVYPQGLTQALPVSAGGRVSLSLPAQSVAVYLIAP